MKRTETQRWIIYCVAFLQLFVGLLSIVFAQRFWYGPLFVTGFTSCWISGMHFFGLGWSGLHSQQC